MLQPSWADLEDACYDTMLERGLRYARERRVSDVHGEALGAAAARVQACVQGTEPAPYEAALTIERSGRELLIEGRCTCAVGYNCKHAVVLIAACGLRPPAPAARVERHVGTPHRPRRALRIARAGSNAYARRMHRRGKARRRPRASSGSYTPSSASRTARGILDEDAALAKTLTAEDLQALFEPLPA